MSPQAILAAGDLALLQAYEPVLRYNSGELFYPMPVEGYLAECDVLAGTGEKDRRVLIPRGEVTPERLGNATAGHGETLYLRFVQEPLGRLELTRWQRRPNRAVFRTPGRLSRVGLFARLVDAGFTASLLLRGTVPALSWRLRASLGGWNVPSSSCTNNRRRAPAASRPSAPRSCPKARP